MLAEIKHFTDAAGLELNIRKTIGIDLTETDEQTDYDYLGILFTSKPVKCLGIYVGKNDRACQDLNWSKKIDSLEKTLDMWKKRELSIFGKILIIMTLAISKITFLLLNSIPPINISKKIKTLLFNFIWGKRDRIKRHILRQDIIHGGVNMVDIETYCLALSASWVPRIINSQQNNWSFYGKQYLRSFDDISKLNYTDSLVFEKLNSIPSFYKNMIINFCKVNQTEKPVSREEILNTYIWGKMDHI